MISFIIEPILFALPFYLANATPIYVKKFNFLDTPIDGGGKFRGKPILGSHKTIRGFVFGIIVGTAVGGITLGSFEHGFILSFTSLLGDLAGAFFKRQSNKKPGEKSVLHDRVLDTAFPITAAYIFGFLYLSVWQILFLIVITLFINNVANLIYYKLKIKDKPW